jgi:TctA family transporter
MKRAICCWICGRSFNFSRIETMSKQGKGSLAIMIDLFCSTPGGLIGVALLITISPTLASFALKFTHFEYFWLGILGLSMSALISKGSNIKVIISIAGGILISTIGIDISTGYPRFTFGNINLMSGISFIPVMIGLFGLSEVLRAVVTHSRDEMTGAAVVQGSKVRISDILKIMFRNKRVIAQSSVIGTLIGGNFARCRLSGDY